MDRLKYKILTELNNQSGQHHHSSASTMIMVLQTMPKVLKLYRIKNGMLNIVLNVIFLRRHIMAIS